ncbi:hypothetical protein D9613_008859 [Agrocybe pediades]|uniref:Uncharacterized protein n=1 Tax=Agrocybe pediades TaxID=84607 RepID=A0A8H4QU38_9AGAR|nr:hypothetical protein D9613_008859 [Agrocybe pediades]
MSFFNTSYKPHIRQEGFNPPNLDNTDSNSPLPSPNNHGFPDMFALPQNYNMGDSQQTTTGTRNKFTPSMDFGEDLASLIEDRQGSSSTSSQYDDHHRYGAGTTHNIFDVSAVPIPHPSSVSSTTTGGLGSQPSSLHSDYPHHPPVFNSTLPALNSSMRYEPLPTPSHQQGSPNMSNPPLSAYHTFSVGGSRHTPSPNMNSHHNDARSRSRSRPPTSGAGAGPSSLSNADSKSPTLANAQNASSIGPARTTRTRRNNSVSGTSPPPYGSMHSRPHAIVIPGSARAQQQQQQGWFVSSQSSYVSFFTSFLVFCFVFVHICAPFLDFERFWHMKAYIFTTMRYFV